MTDTNMLEPSLWRLLLESARLNLADATCLVRGHNTRAIDHWPTGPMVWCVRCQRGL